MSAQSYKFTHAIVRKPSHSIIAGLRASDTGQPDIETFLHHHQDYVNALRSTDAEVTVLEVLVDYPDSVFVEDAALCLPHGAVIMRPGAPSRLGESVEVAPAVSEFYNNVATIDGPGFIEGGDILTTEKEILVGRSDRTDSAGIAELRQLVAPWGYTVREVSTPPSVLHFKTDCSLLDEETILSTPRLAQSGCFGEYRVIETAEGEEACANSIRFNELVIMPEGFPRTSEKLATHGYKLRFVGNTEAARLDGGMSCISLRFSPPKGI